MLRKLLDVDNGCRLITLVAVVAILCQAVGTCAAGNPNDFSQPGHPGNINHPLHPLNPNNPGGVLHQQAGSGVQTSAEANHTQPEADTRSAVIILLLLGGLPLAVLAALAVLTHIRQSEHRAMLRRVAAANKASKT